MRPDISVVLVTHNHSRFVRDAMADIDAQSTTHSLEVIVADDASTDGTRELLAPWVESSPHAVSLLPSEDRLGITANYERAFKACKGRFVAVLEGDDRWIDASKLDVLVAELEAHPAVAFAFNRSVIWYEEQGKALVQPPVGFEDPAPRFDLSQLAHANFIGTFSACMYRRELLDELDPRIFSTTAYDWLVNLCMAAHGPIALVPRVMTAYRVHGEGAWSGLDPHEQLERLAALLTEYDELLDHRVTQELAHHRRALFTQFGAAPIDAAVHDAPPAPVMLGPTVLRRRPLVSVVMPAHNHGPFVEEALESVLTQTVGDLELVVVDDGSTDDTAKRVASLNDPRVRFLRLFPNQGACSAMNLALQQASGELVAVNNSDDTWQPTKLERQLEVLEQEPDLAAVFTGAQLVDEFGAALKLRDMPVWHDVFRQPDRSQGRWLRKFFEYGNCLCHPSVLIRRDVFDAIGFYDNRLRQIPDLHLWVRLAKHRPFRVLGEDQLVNFRVFRDQRNASSLAPPNVARVIHEHLVICRSFFDACPPAILRDGFGDLFVDPMSATPDELECEQALLWMHGPSRLGPIHRFHGLAELYRLRAQPRTRDLLARRYGITDHVLQDLAAQFADEEERAQVDPTGWLAPAFERRPTRVSSGDLARELARRVGRTPVYLWPQRALHHVRRRGRSTPSA
jgi:glycosyltransferase involved in cell wall biosynthesis